MLMPRKVKHRKQHRGRLNGLAKGAMTINFGDFGIQALEPGWLTQRQIEAARIAMTRHVKRGGKVWIRVFLASRMAFQHRSMSPMLARESPQIVGPTTSRAIF